MSPLWLAIASTMSLPLWKMVFLISMPCFAKKPCAIPMSSANPFAIGSPSRVIVASFRCACWAMPAAGPTSREQQDGRADERKGQRQPTNPRALSSHVPPRPW